VAILLGAGAAVLTARALTRQVDEIDRLFRSVGVGEFGARARVLSNDELGRTASGINAMLQQLTNLLEESVAERSTLEAAVSKLVDEIGALATGDLSMQADVDEAATRAIAEAINYAVGELRGLVSRVEEAAVQVTEATGSMTSVVQMVAGQATSSAEMAGQAASSAQEGDRAVVETIGAMERIRENTQETARRIKRLGEASQEISEAVRLIDELSDRTTVLALNASIQAAAAGEAGRGFAVVAEEVQRLAERAAGATREIENLVKSIQAETNEAVHGIEDATREVVAGSQLAQQAGERMADLNRRINDLADLIQHVAVTTTQQTNESITTLGELAQGLLVAVAGFRAAGGDGQRGDNGNRLADPRVVAGSGARQ
jgi:methyl-accepting chemotaxis protein